ncbi:M20 family peptidase [Lutimonas saemankumensis]|uniref:M20 family peptidase n=1 Tax=Lutimonas saemankumensis TaxID=483016 RepID=UPI001CD5E388|nr:M20 family peptidase [Lutimonas saemankumensis]MCA0933746.1 M20 family peptidase [Lutimonas saemankumensis]
MKKNRVLLYTVLSLFALLIAYILINTFKLSSKQLSVAKVDKIEISDMAIDRFSQAIQIQTVSPEDISNFDSLQFVRFNQYLKNSYPLADSLLDHLVFNKFSHLYRWKGTQSQEKPIILMGHLDVVPVIEGNLKYWKQPPFGGQIIRDTLWGRGSIDDKIGVVGVLEAIELLLAQNYQPNRDVYLAIGHDEEIGGNLGARAMANYLIEKGVQAEFIMDEGGSITQGMIPGMDQDVALVGVAEKGSVSIELTVELEGGHSSMPGKETAIDVLSKAISALKSNPFKAQISKPIEGFIEYLGPEMPFFNKMAFANSGLFEPMILKSYEASSSGNALIRTTTAPTIFNSGVKDNIIPLSARATVNFRIISGSSIQEVIDHVKNVIDDERISVKESGFNTEPSKVSSTEAFGFEAIHKSIAEIYPGTIVSPYLVVGATDARHFNEISENIYRFLPVRITKSNIKSFHGINERISTDEFENAVRFYIQLIKNSDQ